MRDLLKGATDDKANDFLLPLLRSSKANRRISNSESRTPKAKLETSKRGTFVQVRGGGLSSFRRKPESRLLKRLKNIWTPVFTGVTISHEAVNFVIRNSLFDIRHSGFGTPRWLCLRNWVRKQGHV
jgi:hypothetical protein